MQNCRYNARLHCYRKCLLQWHGSSYPATIINLSIVALGLHFECSRPEVKIGDDCAISFYDDQKSHPFEFKFHVIRIDKSDIALSCMDTLKHI